MRYDETCDTTATPERVWKALSDVESWPRWLSSYTSVERLDDGPLKIGSRARVQQPGLAAATFEVTDLTPGIEFTWVSTMPGVRTVAEHVVVANDTGGTRLLLSLSQTGLLSGVISLLLRRKIRNYLEIESTGLCAASEADPQG